MIFVWVAIICTIILLSLNCASAAHIAPHEVLNHAEGENDADFRIEMHNLHIWNASIINTGNVTLTNLTLTISGKDIQIIPKLEVGEQKDLIILQPWEFPHNSILYIECNQGAKEEIKLSHAVAESSHWSVRYNSLIKLIGLIVTSLSVIGGIQYRKKK